MEQDNLEFGSKYGRPADYTYRTHTKGSRTITILLPGQAYYKDAPLMWYSAMAAFQAGSDTLSVEYGFQANRLQPDSAAVSTTAAELGDSLKEFLNKHPYEKVIMISKSIGTHFATRLSASGDIQVYRHVFLTPLRGTLDFMSKSQGLMAIVGEKDPLFGEDDIRSARAMGNVKTVTFPGADHLLQSENGYADSLDILKKVADLCHGFVREISN